MQEKHKSIHTGNKGTIQTSHNVIKCIIYVILENYKIRITIISNTTSNIKRQ